MALEGCSRSYCLWKVLGYQSLKVSVFSRVKFSGHWLYQIFIFFLNSGGQNGYFFPGNIYKQLTPPHLYFF